MEIKKKNNCSCLDECNCRISKIEYVDYDSIAFNKFDNISIFKQNIVKERNYDNILQRSKR